MADLVTLADLKARILAQADMTNSDFIEDYNSLPASPGPATTFSELTQMIRGSIQDLYNIIVTANEDYYISEKTFSTVAGQRDYNLTTIGASDFLKFLGLDYLDSAGRIYPLKRFLFKERTQLSNMATGSSDGYNLFYRVMDQKIRVMPIPSSVFSLTLTYIPTATLPVWDADTFDFIHGGDDYVMWDVVSKCLAKEESDTSIAIAAREGAKAQILNLILNRDSGDAERVLNVWDYSSGRSRPHGSDYPPDEM